MVQKIVVWLVSIGLFGWVVGIILQLLIYGYVAEPCCQ